jgi:hypothetical protein
MPDQDRRDLNNEEEHFTQRLEEQQRARAGAEDALEYVRCGTLLAPSDPPGALPHRG